MWLIFLYIYNFAHIIPSKCQKKRFSKHIAMAKQITCNTILFVTPSELGLFQKDLYFIITILFLLLYKSIISGQFINSIFD
jgi:hypothetical protein